MCSSDLSHFLPATPPPSCPGRASFPPDPPPKSLPFVNCTRSSESPQPRRKEKRRRPGATRRGWLAVRACIHARRSVDLAGPRRFRDIGFAVAASATDLRPRGSPRRRRRVSSTSGCRDGTSHCRRGQRFVRRSSALAVDPDRRCFTCLLRRLLREGARQHAGCGRAGPHCRVCCRWLSSPTRPAAAGRGLSSPGRRGRCGEAL